MAGKAGVWTVNHTRSDKPDVEALAQRFVALGLIELQSRGPLSRGIAEAYRLAVRLVAELPDEDILDLAAVARRTALRGAEAS